MDENIRNALIEIIKNVISIILAGVIAGRIIGRFLVDYIISQRISSLVKKSQKGISKSTKNNNYKYLEKSVNRILDICNSKPQITQELIDFITEEFFKRHFSIDNTTNKSKIDVDKFIFVLKNILILKCRNKNNHPLNVDL